MRSRGPSKQRLWLGPGRCFCCCGRRHTDADAHCHSDGDRHANCQSHCDSNGDGYAATNANTQAGANAKAASHASAEAIGFAAPKISSDRRSLESDCSRKSTIGAARGTRSHVLPTRSSAALSKSGQSLIIVLTVFSDSARKAFYSRNRGKLISGAGSELVSLRLGPFQPQPLLSNENEICVSLCPA